MAGAEGAEGAEGAVARARAERDAAEASLRERLRERRGLSPEDASTSVTAMLLAPAAPGSYNGYSKGYSKGCSKVQATAARVAGSSRCRSHRRRAGERTAAGDFTQMRLTMWLVGS